MPKVPLLLAIDIGTESSRACLLKDNGEVVATASTEHSSELPQSRLGRTRPHGLVEGDQETFAL